MSNLIDAHLAHCRHAGLAGSTIEDRGRLLRAADRALPYGLDAATHGELLTWLAAYTSPQTRHTYSNHLRQFYRWATDPDDPWLTLDPTTRLPRVRVPGGIPHPATVDELDTALARLPQPWDLAVKLAAYAGLRCGDIADQDRGDITAQTLRVRRGKGGRPAILPTHPVIWDAVRDLPAGLVIPGRPPRTPGRRWVSQRLQAMLDRIGLPHLSAHSFRHFFGTELYRTTRDLRLVQELMRHSSPATTAVYTLITGEERRLAVHALPTVAAASM
ncbi:MAG TPA: site-specific integrase [Micromonosporaceae bacterium]|nr:site-specific integrase [Micromonosporaceae bacterium]